MALHVIEARVEAHFAKQRHVGLERGGVKGLHVGRDCQAMGPMDLRVSGRPQASVRASASIGTRTRTIAGGDERRA